MADASAPASSANLGPAFDTVAVAVEFRCRVSAVPADEWSVVHTGPERLPDQHRDRALEAARRASKSPLALTVDNQIPIARGLGSSSAAAASAAAAAMRANGDRADLNRIFVIVGEMDGHWDNGAAAVFGGLQAVTSPGQARSLEWHESLRLVVAIPEESIPTEISRSVLSDGISMDEAIRTLSRTVSLLEGLRTGDPALLGLARGDELHETRRVPLYAEAARLIEAAQAAGAFHSYLSGAGSSVAAVVDDQNRAKVRSSMEDILGENGRVIDSHIASQGVL